MPQPLVVTIPHSHGKAEATRRIKDGIDWARTRYGSLVTIGREDWSEEGLDFKVGALGQSAQGTIRISDTDATLSLELPWLLARFADKVRNLVSQRGNLMLEKK